MTGSPEDICLFACSRAPGTRGGLGAAPSREGEPEPWGHVAAPELPRVRSGSPSHDDTWRPRSCPELGAGARDAGTHGGLRATLSREAGAIVLTRSLCVGVPGPQGTDIGPRAHLRIGCELVGGANILSPRSLSESLCVGIPKRWCSTANTWRPTIHAGVAMLVEPSRAAVSRGPLLPSRNSGAWGNHEHDSRTDGTPLIRDAWGFHFSAAAPPSRHPALTDERGLDPLVNVWVCGARGVGTKRPA
jgi:hypothetical protein